MRKDAVIEVAMATFRGESFLAEQLRSIAGQVRKKVRLFVRDDGSDDRTEALISSASARGMDITVLPSDGIRLGPRENFSRILSATSASYVALCDQDDLWDSQKLDRMYTAMEAIESTSPEGMPILVCSDLRLIDKTGAILAPSYWRHQGYDPLRGSSFSSLLIMNCFPGCSMLANRALLDRALPIPVGAVMHDWWLGLVAAAIGQVVIVREPLMSYRIHGHNAVGIPARSFGILLRRFRGSNGNGVRIALAAAVRQAKELQGRFGILSNPTSARKLQAFCSLDQKNWLGRRWTLLHQNIVKHGFLRQVNLALRA